MNPSHAHQAIGNMGGRGKCSRYIYYRPHPPKSLIEIKKIYKKSVIPNLFRNLQIDPETSSG